MQPKKGARGISLLTRNLRLLDMCIVLLGAVALILVGLRPAFAATPLILFFSTLFLFMVPGLVLSRRFLDEHISGLATVPVAFTISAGIFGLFGVPVLILHGSLESYLWIAGAIVAASLAAAAFGTLRKKRSRERDISPASHFSWLWVPFLLLNTLLASASTVRAQGTLGDMWVYLAWVRQFLNENELALHEPYFESAIATVSRVKINGWLLEQAAFSRVSGIDPIDLILVGYLKPTLVVMSLLAFYALAQILLKSETAALLAGSLYAMFFLTNLEPTAASLGGEFIGRVTEDKFVARALFLPVALIFAFLFLESRKRRYLALFAFLCWAVVAIHPAGLAIIGLSTAGFGLVRLAVNWRKKDAWIGTASLGGALLSVFLAPVLYVLATGRSLVAVLQTADINSGDPDVLANIVFLLPWRDKILELDSGYYIMHPSLLLYPAILVALLVGLPFLLWRLKHGLSAQLLVGMLLMPTTVCFVPPIATFFGDHIVSPGQLWRLAWPIPPAALLIVGWMVWEVTRHAQIGLSGTEGSRRAARVLPLVILCALMVVVAPASVDRIRDVYGADEVPPNVGFRFDPVFRWMQDNITQTSVVLAPDWVNASIPAYSAQANVVSLRGNQVIKHLGALERRAPGEIDVPRGALDVRRFFSSSPLEEKLRIIRRYEADYVMVHAGSSLNRTLKNRPGFTTMDVPGERYRLYAVDLKKLAG